jgi:hypothetical protein
MRITYLSAFGVLKPFAGACLTTPAFGARIPHVKSQDPCFRPLALETMHCLDLSHALRYPGCIAGIALVCGILTALSRMVGKLTVRLSEHNVYALFASVSAADLLGVRRGIICTGV